jgi:hypothetical protein
MLPAPRSLNMQLRGAIMLRRVFQESPYALVTVAMAIAGVAVRPAGVVAQQRAGVVERDLGTKQSKPGKQRGDAACGRQAALVAVVATGAGETPDAARQNAFSAAIEQVVGALVDAETIVKNDQVVRDQVLTYSRGYVEEFDVVASWERVGCTTAASAPTSAGRSWAKSS